MELDELKRQVGLEKIYHSARATVTGRTDNLKRLQRVDIDVTD